MKKIILIFILQLTTVAFAQKTISGTIDDAGTGDPLPEVTVVIENTTTGTTTDFDGKFSLQGNTNTFTLVIRYLGYETQKIKITSATSVLKIALKEDAAQLDQVVVTANKTAQRSQDVPLSITAIGAKELTRTGSVKAEDYFPSIPNLSVSSAGGGGASFGDGRSSGKNISIRGISGQNTTAFYLDETPLPEFADPRLFDTNRIEVLRGPQGTLYGSNTMGGAVKVITNNPNAFDTSGSIDVSTAKVKEGDADYSFQSILNIPLIKEKLALRVGAFYAFETGIYDRKQQTSFNGFPLNTEDGTGANPGAVFDNPDGSGVRIPYNLGSLPIVLQQNGNNDLAGNFRDNVDDEKSYGINIGLGFYPNDRVKIIPKFIYQKTQGDGLDFADFKSDNFTQYRVAGIDEKYELDLLHASLLTQFEFKNGQLTNNISFTNLDQFDREDVTERESSGNTSTELTPFDENGLIIGAVDEPQFTNTDYTEAYFYPEFIDRTGSLNKLVEELRYSSTNEDSKLNFTAGLFYSSESSKFNASQPRNKYLGDLSDFFKNLIELGVTEVEGLPEFIAAENYIWYSQDTNFQTNELALFGELYWDITPKLKATFGLRYFSYNQKLEQKLAGFIAAGGGEPTNEETNDSGFTPKFNLTYNINENSLVYGSATRGYRLGGANGIVPVLFAAADLEAIGLTEAPRTFEPDFLWTYEIGSKNTFLGNKLITNMSLFHTVWNDLQQRVFLPTGFLFVDNIGQAKMTGVELEIKGKVNQNLQIGGAFGYTKAEIQEGSILTGAEKGDRVLNVPELTASANIQYAHTLKNKDNSMFYRLDLNHSGDRVNTFSPETQSQFVFDAYTTLSARVGYTSKKIRCFNIC
ncbi:TonB-dependent receptor [Polaribacter sp. L3A8]|uniref:TonB-dependent receptor n=1 Tax=Polaribacter sp. L3A8 TaxID=2686361 RepID=UPI00131B0F33|nr:TonB-dependent receptor [Polaribacter sp. L3A8]